RGREGEGFAVRPPGELLHACGDFGDLKSVTSIHRENKDLGMAVHGGKERQPVATGRPARRAEAAAALRECALLPGGDVNQHQFAIVVVVFVVRPRNNHGYTFSVRRYLRVSHTGELPQMLDLKPRRER